MVYQRSGADRCMDGHVQGSVGLLSVMVCVRRARPVGRARPRCYLFAERDQLAVDVDVCGDLVWVVAQIDGWMGM